MLVEECEGDDVAVKRHWHLLVARHKPLHRIFPPMEKTTLNKALHACIGTSERCHESMEDGRAYGDAKATALERRLQI